MTKLPLSLVIISRNEEKNISRCIESVPFASEVLVVDSHSTDQTKQIAESLGARVLVHDWQGFGLQKKWAAEQAKFDWILSLDADEALSKEAQAEIIHKFQELSAETGYFLPRLSFHLGRWIRHGGWYPDYQLRLFNRQYGNWNAVELHERVQIKKTERLTSPILHWVFKNLSHNVITNDRYSSLGAEEVWAQKPYAQYLKLWLKPPIKFLECYFFKLGFLDGTPGFIIAVGAAYSMFLRYAKVWEKSELSKLKGGH